MSPRKNKAALVLISKPAGLTSFDCIRKLKKAWNRPDIGHGGTLDKFATGLLPIFIGEGLKLSRFYLESYPALPTYWKRYSAVVELGKLTDTLDPEGELVEQKPVPELNLQKIQEVLNTFLDGYDQTAPIYSAKKIDGKRSSDYARDGETVEPKVSKVFIRDITVLSYNKPFLEFETTCSKGTYIRSLARDLAIKLETVGYVQSLTRLGVGDYLLSRCVAFEDALNADPEEIGFSLLDACEMFPKKCLDSKSETDFLNGNTRDLFNQFLAEKPQNSVYLFTGESQNSLGLVAISENGKAEFLRAFVQN